ncbi:DNA gyrase inhibitor YacG [Pelagibius sp. CAU 1746]|uniref:DNA gyrase inhibitor YacG n=1 Tax=Pelagibius sp. CAU 1746 TaxID=3140370 RepID=UPI00325C2F04
MSDKTDDLDKVVPLSRKDGGRRKCPICKAPAVHRYRPFCSQRCADIDLGRWVKGNYAIPTDEVPDGSGPDAGAPLRDSDEDF